VISILTSRVKDNKARRPSGLNHAIHREWLRTRK
jgi:hypothetical protein